MDNNRLIKFLITFLLKWKNTLIIFDNVSCHSTETVKNLIKLNNILYTILYDHCM